MADNLDEQIEEINKLLVEETSLWAKEVGADPNNVVEFNNYLQQIHVDATIGFLIEKGIVDEKEYTLFFKQHLLKTLAGHREGARAARKRAIIENIVPRMDIPRDLH